MNRNIFNGVMFLIEITEEALMIFGIFLSPRNQNRKRWILGILLLLGMLGTLLIIDQSIFFVQTIDVFVPLLIWQMWIKGGTIRKLAVTACGVLYLYLPYLCIDLITVCFTEQKLADLPGNIEYRFFRGAITILLIGGLSLFVRKLKRYREIMENADTLYYVVGSICGVAALLVESSIEEMVAQYGDSALSVVLLVCVFVVSLVLYSSAIALVLIDFLRKKYKKESSLKGRYLDLVRKYVETIRNNEQETRRIRHDIRTHIMVLQHYLEEGKVEDAYNYLNEMQQNYDKRIRRLNSVNHDVADAVILQYQMQGEEYGIQWLVEGKFPEKIQITDFDLCTLFANLLSNAVEASRKTKEGERRIHVDIRKIRSYFILIVENSVFQPVDIKMLGSATSKTDKDNHGFGIRNMKDIVSKYDGEIGFENLKNGIFSVKVIFRM